jgi:hypothetical protein
VGTTGAELDDRATCGSRRHTRGLARGESLEMKCGEETGFNELGFGDRSSDAEHGFAGKEDRAFRESPNIAGEAELREIFEEVGTDVAKERQSAQTHPLQQARQRRALCGLGTAATLFRRGSRGLQTTALVRAEWRRVRRACRLPLEHAATTENSEKVRRSESRNYCLGPGKRASKESCGDTSHIDNFNDVFGNHHRLFHVLPPGMSSDSFTTPLRDL